MQTSKEQYEEQIARLQKKLQEKDQKLSELKEQIDSQNKLTTEKDDKIRLQAEHIQDSINYALRIQQAILPPEYYVKKLLPDSFFHYVPKDVVSGDFYYVEEINDHVIWAAVDCTGHGVPGAMMSVIGYNILDHAIKLNQLTKPGDILSFLDEGVTDTLRQFENESGVKDGMDLALCSWNKKTNEITYAGAYNPVVYIRGKELFQVKADKLPIGVNVDGVVDEYTTHKLDVNKGDLIYLYSDGYADQFGGPKDRKFMYKKLKQLLLEHKDKTMAEQEKILDYTMQNWKGDQEQVDDILVIGVRV
jgi:phosphoserine phosphatase RsbU/P